MSEWDLVENLNGSRKDFVLFLISKVICIDFGVQPVCRV